MASSSLTKYAYPASAAKTKRMQTIIQAEMAVMPSTLGETEVTLLKMLMRTRKSVMSMAMRPGTTSGGIRNEAHEVITNRPGKD